MAQNDDLEDLLVRLMHHVCERLTSKAIVKGGMVLRLLDCPRNTNDLDLVLVPYGSKKDAGPMFQAMLESFQCSSLEVKVHSTAIRAIVREGRLVAKVEASVAMDCPSIAMSTASLAAIHSELPRIVRVMRFDVALSNKLGAWLERGLYRDLYDIFYWTGIQKTQPHWPTLKQRLAHLKPRRDLPKSCTMEQLAQRLEHAATELDESALLQELTTTLPDSEFVGLVPRMRSVLVGFAQRIPHMDQESSG